MAQRCETGTRSSVLISVITIKPPQPAEERAVLLQLHCTHRAAQNPTGRCHPGEKPTIWVRAPREVPAGLFLGITVRRGLTLLVSGAIPEPAQGSTVPRSPACSFIFPHMAERSSRVTLLHLF